MERYHHDGLVFDVIDSGPAEGTGVVLLHGFPQDGTAWSAVTPILNAAGLRTLAPHQRGYSSRARPQHRSAYRTSVLARDVLALLDAAGLDRAHVVGHDWGGGVAWYLGARHRDRVAGLTVLSTPHPRALARAMTRSDQARRSWYMLAAQLPWLPERRFAAQLGDLTSLGLDPEHARAYARRLSEPGALTGALNWYRGMAVRGRRRPDATGAPKGPRVRDDTITCPVSYLWGTRDPYLGRYAAEHTAQYCTGDYRFTELDAGHWLPEKHPEAVAAAVLERIGRPAP